VVKSYCCFNHIQNIERGVSNSIQFKSIYLSIVHVLYNETNSNFKYSYVMNKFIFMHSTIEETIF